MKKLVRLSLVVVLATSCNAQKKNEQDVAQNKAETHKEKPKGTWKVDKELDENGNTICYDSIYSWSSSEDLDGFNEIDGDSLMQKFQSRFVQHFSNGAARNLSGFFREDSVLMKQFFGDDFFGGNFEQVFPDMEEMRERMQAIQKQFMQIRHQRLIPAGPEEK